MLGETAFGKPTRITTSTSVGRGGVINIESPHLNHFDQNNIEIFTRIANQIAYTVTNAELFRQKTTAHSILLNLNDLPD